MQRQVEYILPLQKKKHIILIVSCVKGVTMQRQVEYILPLKKKAHNSYCKLRERCNNATPSGIYSTPTKKKHFDSLIKS
jgi:hypothetical protein